MIQNVIILVLTALASAFPVVSQPFQALSEVSVTHKAVGSRLPRLCYRAIG